MWRERERERNERVPSEEAKVCIRIRVEDGEVEQKTLELCRWKQ